MRSLTVAFTTFQESVRQPAFYALLVLGVVLLVFSFYMPTFTLTGGEAKFVRDIGLGTITLCILLLGIFSSANLITTEIENKTAMTVMSKPLRRHEFIIGKYLGIIMSVGFLAILFTAVFLPVIAAKVTAGDIVRKEYEYAGLWTELSGIFPAIFLGLCEAAVLISVSVALSTRMPMIINVVLSFTLFILANISGPLVALVADTSALMAGPAKFFYYAFPNFLATNEVFSAVGLGKPVSPALVGWTVVYTVVYVVGAISAAVFLFQDRELG